MCQHCRSNSARYIAGHAVREYRDRFLNGEEWRLKLCTNLQAILLTNLCDLKITPDTAIRHNKDLRNSLWSRSGLDFRYDHNFGSVLRTKYADKAQSLLSEINKWDAFIVVQSGDQKVYYWNTDILIRHSNSVDQVARWIEDKRAQARASSWYNASPLNSYNATISYQHATRWLLAPASAFLSHAVKTPVSQRSLARDDCGGAQGRGHDEENGNLSIIESHYISTQLVGAGKHFRLRDHYSPNTIPLHPETSDNGFTHDLPSARNVTNAVTLHHINFPRR
ncbi:hypothetical protein CEP54_014432 [Fusarium duplospermum]|uniref:Uncharacterized protein n=1 Tax=Fusarium duplospermum TaxID=1325734 RepID=A0A428NWB2_9HYPO|nr:hypothetical protein CEP54_014432 [Fusarium duplospermum]